MKFSFVARAIYSLFVPASLFCAMASAEENAHLMCDYDDAKSEIVKEGNALGAKVCTTSMGRFKTFSVYIDRSTRTVTSFAGKNLPYRETDKHITWESDWAPGCQGQKAKHLIFLDRYTLELYHGLESPALPGAQYGMQFYQCRISDAPKRQL